MPSSGKTSKNARKKTSIMELFKYAPRERCRYNNGYQKSQASSRIRTLSLLITMHVLYYVATTSAQKLMHYSFKENHRAIGYIAESLGMDIYQE